MYDLLLRHLLSWIQRHVEQRDVIKLRLCVQLAGVGYNLQWSLKQRSAHRNTLNLC